MLSPSSRYPKFVGVACFAATVALLPRNCEASFATTTFTSSSCQRKLSTAAKAGRESGATVVSSKRRQPWDFFRFLQQTSKFVRLPNPLVSPKNTEARIVQPGDVLWAPGNLDDFSFGPLDDVVMGGVSASTVDNKTGIWKGTVSDANSGGFVGIRSTPFAKPLDMAQCVGVEFRLRLLSGEGRRFKAVVRDSTEFNGVGWTTSFTLPEAKTWLFQRQGADSDDVVTVRIPFRSQTPAIFARRVPDQTFQKDNVVGLQIAYSKFEFDGELNAFFALGDFALQIVDLRAY